MVKGRGNKETPPRVVELLSKAVSENGLIGIENATGVGKSALSRYVKGIGEPTTATLQKLADYFKTSLSYLRGDPWATRDGKIDFNHIAIWDAYRKMEDIDESYKDFLGKILFALEDDDDWQADRPFYKCLVRLLEMDTHDHLKAYGLLLDMVSDPRPKVMTMEEFKAHNKRIKEEIGNK